MKLRINKETLKDIAEAIRSKDVFTDGPIKVENFSQKISDLNYIHKVVITSGNELFYHEPWTSICPLIIDHCVIDQLSDAASMFAGTDIESIPFDIIFYPGASVSIRNMFGSCEKLKSPPTFITNNNEFGFCDHLFYNCSSLEEFPEGWGKDLVFATYYSPSYLYGDNSSMFWGCHSLLNLPYEFLDQDAHPYAGASETFYRGGFYSCVSLPAINNLPVLTNTICSENMFSLSFDNLCSLKCFTFKREGKDIVRWRNQAIDLSEYVGYYNSYYKTLANSKYSSDNEVKDEDTYNSLNNSEYWWTYNLAYSRYNHDSAVETINSLPDTSAYLETEGGTNIIKFKGEAGSKTEGGAINTLTEEEIAVAAVKGWTVTFG